LNPFQALILISQILNCVYLRLSLMST